MQKSHFVLYNDYEVIEMVDIDKAIISTAAQK